MKKTILTFMAAALCLTAFAQTGPDVLIPKPASYTILPGEAKADVPVKISYGSRKIKAMVKDLPDYARKEAYLLTIKGKATVIEALTEEGAFRGKKTLDYMKEMAGGGPLKACEVFDYPRFRYRGLMFDISRHFRSKEFILKQLDLMASIKMNVLHIHLTDDAGWRIQIDKYPLLTGQAAWRPEKLWKDWDVNGHNYSREGADRAFGGYLTKDNVKEIVKYAAERHITVIPEIELPGHSLEVLKAYPTIACLDSTGTHPVFTSDLCPGSDEALRMYKDILDEVLELFPSQFIHIGGDEAGKASWAHCPRCQARMKEHALKDVDELQSWFVRQFDTYLASKGRRLLGWDEIMQGGLAPGATVMSWRGTSHGINAAAEGHDVVMSPGDWCYINHNQDNPLALGEYVGGYLPLSRVYEYDPADGFKDTAHLLGLQGNLWTEHVPTDENFEFKLYPRSFALAEVGWSPQEVRNDFQEFRARAVALADHIRGIGYHPFDLHTEWGDRPERNKEVKHLARGCKVIFNTPYANQYKAAGDATLTDGLQGGWTYSDGRWQGFESDIDIIVDLGKTRQVNFVGAHFLANIGAWIGFPEKIQIQTSPDGVNFADCTEVLCQVKDTDDGSVFVLLGDFIDVQTRYIRFKALRKNLQYHDWLFIDELIIN